MPQNSAHWPGRRPGLSALNQLFVRPGIASILPPSAGIHQLWITSSSGAVTVERDDRPTGTRRRSTAIAPFGYRELPVELVALDLDVERARPALAVGDVLDPGQLVEDEGADRRRGSRPARPSR